jgi:TetR/AcrR family tetracycline transcriptional repressor
MDAIPARRGLARGTLSRDRIVSTAVELIDREGIPALTMRHLAAQLGCEAMSLYKHVPDKQRLLHLVTDAILEEFRRPARTDWRTEIESVAGELRRVALAHPNAFSLIVEQLPNSRTGLAPVNALLEALRTTGLGERELVGAFWAVVAYATGALVAETAALRGVKQPFPAEVSEALPGLDPGVAHLGPRLANSDWATEYAHGLGLLLDAIAARTDD